MSPELEQIIYACRDCRVWDPENQPSVMRTLQTNPEAYADRVLATVRSGTTITFPGLGEVPLWVEILTCAAHQQALEVEGASS